MKKWLVLLLFIACSSNIMVFANTGQCNCSSSYIVNRLLNASSTDTSRLFEKLIDDASFSPGFTTRGAFAEIMYDSRDEYEFKDAIGEYIENNCSVSNNKIYCR